MISKILDNQKFAAGRSAHYHAVARLRILQGYLGAAIFYQHQAATWHQRAIELRNEYDRQSLFDRIPERSISNFRSRPTEFVRMMAR